ncbi:MAG: DUF4358 domain-containing protein [Clostridium sp.]|nr:DUF4358 domain-containing protein [Clostridium sp.]
MKKVLISGLMLAMVSSALIGCGKTTEVNSNITAKEIASQMIEENYLRAPMEASDSMASELYHLNLDDVENYAIYETQISPGPGFIMIVKAKEGKLESVKNSMEKVLEDKIGNAFYPDEREIAEKATIEVDGNFVSLFLLNSEVEADAEKLYNKLIKK